MTLTPARRRALEVMAAVHPRPVRYSNATALTSGAGLVYWECADWLTGHEPNLAQLVDSGGLVLTAAGLAACRANGIEVPRA
jgi:hypothetical protein